MASFDIKSLSDQDRLTLVKALNGSGIFITTGAKSETNIMSTHWGSFGTFWNKAVFILPIRKNKLSHKLVTETRSFGISVPIKDMRNELMLCDHLSGYDVNKFETLHLHPRRAQEIPTYLISECNMYFECKVIFKDDMYVDGLDSELYADMYENGKKDLHTLFFGEIVAFYKDDPSEFTL